MQKIVPLIMISMFLAACSVKPPLMATEPFATGIPPANIPNPASVYCDQHGNKLEIQTAGDGSQSGLCVFPDGQTCEEWAYFRGECGPTAQTISDNAMNAIVTEAVSTPNGSSNAGVKVTFIGNAGFMITTSHKKILN